jgi:hypothetical protein
VTSDNASCAAASFRDREAILRAARASMTWWRARHGSSSAPRIANGFSVAADPALLPPDGHCVEARRAVRMPETSAVGGCLSTTSETGTSGNGTK